MCCSRLQSLELLLFFGFQNSPVSKIQASMYLYMCSNLHRNCKAAMWQCQMHIPFTYCSLMSSPDSYIFCLKPHHDRDLRILAHLVTSPFAPKSSLALQKACLLLCSFSPFLTEISMSCGLGMVLPNLVLLLRLSKPHATCSFSPSLSRFPCNRREKRIGGTKSNDQELR